jgi:hypothetical protein
MKTKCIIHVVLIILSGVLFTGCFGPGWGGGNAVTYTIHNGAEIDSTTNFTKENTPFRIPPPALHAPMLSKKGQVALYGDVGDALSAGMAVAISDKDAIMVNVMGGWGDITITDSVYVDIDYQQTSNTTTNTVDVSGYYMYKRNTLTDSYGAEVAYGRFQSIRKKIRNEWFTGIGYGKITNEYDIEFSGDLPYYNISKYESTYKDDRNHLNFFFQDDIGWVTRHVEFIFIGRMNSYLFTSRETSINGQTQTPGYSPWAFSFEPAVRFAFGFGQFRLYAQCETVLPIEASGINWYKPQFKGGMLFRFGK